MAANCGKSSTRDGDIDDDAEEVKEGEQETTCGGSVETVHKLLDDMAKRQQASATQDATNDEGKSAGFHQNVATATQIGLDLWGQHHVQWGATATHDDMTQPATMFHAATEQSTKKRKKKKNDPVESNHAHITMTYRNVQRWFRDLENSDHPPNARQMAVLQGVRRRCEQEAREVNGLSPQRPGSEPLRGCVLGVPGAGKSECIKWLQRFF